MYAIESAYNVGTTEQPVYIICSEDNYWREIVETPTGVNIISERYFCWQCMDFHPQL